MLYVGGGILLVDVVNELKEFVDYLNILVVYFLMGKGVFSDDYDLILGMIGFWGMKFINEKCWIVDYILVLGIWFVEVDFSFWELEYMFDFLKIKLFYIDIDFSEIGCNYFVEIGVVVDLK